MATFLPELPFDGQQFIDAFRVRWVYDSSVNGWQRTGTVPDLPLATELQPGLMSAQLKTLLDGIPENGGHFGIIANPLLTLKPQKQNIIISDKVRRIYQGESGTVITGVIPNDRPYNSDQYAGKLLKFKTGKLTNKTYLIFTNDESHIYLEGDASVAAKDDSFDIISASEFNPSGVLYGDLTLVSESLDITCVDGKGNPFPSNCNLDTIQADDPDNPPSLSFTLNDNFLNNLCVTIPGCQGPVGSQGEKGATGAPGTGDGPQGEQGDPGEDAPATANTFTGIKIVEVDDIYDTAIVAMELDATNNKLGIVKAKIRTPDSDTPANQVISTPVSRSIRFTNSDTFEYEILMPPLGDPIGEADIDILKYPKRFKPSGDDETPVSRIKLSSLIDKIIEYYDDQLSEINDRYNLAIKSYIDGKDEAARTILANLADELARCEFELPIDFCLGINPNDCSPNKDNESSYAQAAFAYPLASSLFGVTEDKTALDLGDYIITPTATNGLSDVFTSVKYPNSSSDVSTVTLPPGGYVIQWLSGTVKSSATNYLVGPETAEQGLVAIYTDGGPEITLPMPVPTISYNDQEAASVEFAYQEAPVTEKVIAIEISDPGGGTIKLKAELPGINPQGSIKVKVLQVNLA